MKESMKTPLKQSPLHHVARALGATLGPHHGWNIATQFATPDAEAASLKNGVGIADASWLGKLELKGPQAELESITIDEGKTWSLARGQYFILCDPMHGGAIIEFIEQQVAERESEDPAGAGCIHVIDATSTYAGILLAGPHSRDVLQRLTAPDVSEAALANGACLSAKVAGLHTRIVRDDLDETLAYWLFVGTEYAAYAWEAIMHAGQQFGIVPVGQEATQRMRSANQ